MSNRALITALLIALLGLLLSERAVAPLRQVTGAIVYPLSGPLTDVTQALRSVAATVRQIGLVRQEATRLADENRTLQARVAELEAVRHENETLKAALSFEEQHQEQPLVPARVIGRAPQTFLQSVEIDRGESDDVELAAPVVADGFLVGTITRRTAHRATVQLITSSEAKVAAVFTRSRAQGIVRGGLGGLVASQVPLDLTIEPDEPVVTSGLGGVVPPNIPIGVAGQARSLSSSILQELDVRSPVRFSTLEFVFVGTPLPGGE